MIARLDALLVECGRQQDAIYRCEGVSAPDALAFIARAARLIEALCAVTSLDSYDDVVDLLEDAI